MKRPNIVVAGSSNTDMVVRTARLPSGGETVMGEDFLMNAGGKGANQAVAAARLGAYVIFIAKTGDDIFGQRAREDLAREGIDCSCILTDPNHPSGVALITVDHQAENCIVVAPGANAALLPIDIASFREIIVQSSVILLQLEIPLESVEYMINIASEKNIRTILNPAPAAKLSDELLRKVSVITPNETEATLLTDIPVKDFESAGQAARALKAKGVETVIITMGSQGALLLEKDELIHVSAPSVKPMDTTAAGDVFNGALAVALLENKTMQEAVEFGCKAAAISVTRLGAQSSAPYRKEIIL